MASDNETVAEAIAAERHHIECAKADAEDLEIECEFTDEEVVAIIDRILTAHRREMEAKDAEVERWRKQALEEDDAALVHCAEISKLKALVKELADALDNLDYAFGMEIKRQLVKKAMEVVK